MTCSQKNFFWSNIRKIESLCKIATTSPPSKAVHKGPWSGIFEISIYINYKATVDVSI